MELSQAVNTNGTPMEVMEVFQAVNTNGTNGGNGTPKEVFQAVSTTRQTSQGKRATLVARTAGSSN
jgi:hypothetical protein